MRKRWKWLVLVVLVLGVGFLVTIPKEPDVLEPFRKLGPISEGPPSGSGGLSVVMQTSPAAPPVTLTPVSKEFKYGPMSPAKFSEFRQLVQTVERTSAASGGHIVLVRKYQSAFNEKGSTVVLDIIETPNWFEIRWTQVKRLFGI